MLFFLLYFSRLEYIYCLFIILHGHCRHRRRRRRHRPFQPIKKMKQSKSRILCSICILVFTQTHKLKKKKKSDR